MKKIFAKIHLWLAIPLGIILSIICLSGALLVFETEILETLHRGRYFIKEKGAEVMPMDELIAKVNANLEDNSVNSVTIPADTDRNYVLSLSKGFRVSAYVNPYTGDIVDIVEGKGAFFGTMLRLHRWLLDSGRTGGKAIVGYSTLLFVVILISGIVIWWPRKNRRWSQRLKINTKYGKKRFWVDLHTAGGMYVVAGLLVLALTGLTFSFGWYNKAFYKVLGVEVAARGARSQQPNAAAQNQGGRPNGVRTENSGGRPERINAENAGGRPENQGRVDGARPENGNGMPDGANDDPKAENQRDNKTAETDNGSKYVHWDSVIRQIEASSDDYKSISVREGTATVAPRGKWGNARASNQYTFDNATGEILSYKPYAEQERSSRVRGCIYTIHVGAWGGLFSKIITFLVALAGAILPITGYYIFYRKNKKPAKR